MATILCPTAGGILLWLAFPPLGWWPLAWVAPLPWLWLIQVSPPKAPRSRVIAWAGFLLMWWGGFLFWLLILQGIRLAHPALIGGWIALSFYLAFYLPAFVLLTRVAVHRLRISLVIAAPVVWVGLELIRGYLLTGFSLALLAHSQVPWTTLLQIADLAGAYGVSFVMMLTTACISRVGQDLSCRYTSVGRINPALQERGRINPALRLWPVVVAVVALAATLGYGTFRLHETLPADSRGPARVALIQGSLDTVFEITPERIRETLEHYQALTAQARRDHTRLDLVVWPESMFIVPERQVEEPLAPPPGAEISAEEVRQRILAANSDFEVVLANLASQANTLPTGEKQPTPVLVLVGTATYVYGAGLPKTYNTALLADPQGKVAGRYFKMHAVMFGEYVPLADRIPWLATATPLGSGMSVGREPQVFEVAGLRMSPSICFESVVPHLIRSHLLQLQRQGKPADVLVNVTNDGWFWGSAILDHHLACAVMRTVENRKPMLIAANTGISAWIDGNGTILAQAPRRQPQVIVAAVRPDGRRSLYHLIGDVPASLCGLACLLLAAIASRPEWRFAFSRGGVK